MIFKRRKFYFTEIEEATIEDLKNRERPIKNVLNEGYDWKNYARLNDFNLNPIQVDHYLLCALTLEEYFFLRAIKCMESIVIEQDILYEYEGWFKIDFDNIVEFGYMNQETAMKAALSLKNKGLIDVVNVESVIYCTIFDQYINDIIAGYIREGFNFSSHFPK